jgi:NAD(P)-dependent dehydrogenase (short-subunit alcohol dehydrogenase family)
VTDVADTISFAGRTALVSGIGPGLGRELALRFARAGADVVLAARTASYLDEVAAEVEALGRVAVPVPADITNAEDCARIAQVALAATGRIDAVVHNAYVGLPFTRFEDADLAQWRAMMDVNTFGALRVTQAVLPALRAQGGSVVFINTQQIRRVFASRGSYAVSKAALFTAAQVLAKELGPDRIRVNSVVVGWMDGPPLQGYFESVAASDGGASVAEQRAQVEATNPLGMIPGSVDAASAALFLASDLAAAITGQSLDVNAGETFT